MMLTVLNLPSLVCILFILTFEKNKKKTVPKWLYIFISVLTFTITLILYKDITEDPRNIFPIFEESIYIIILLCIISNLLAYISLRLKKRCKF